AAKLHHPNIVAAYTALRLGESLVLAMEYVEGLDLSRLVKARGPLPVANACSYVHQPALGLQHAHEHDMVHRDIKPSNLMLAKQGKRAIVKVLDFGLAKLQSEGAVDGGLTHEGQMLGTPDYIAPEQISNARKADIRADIYSLGCTLYHLLTARPPFQGDSLYDLLQAHHSMVAPLLNLVRPQVPAEVAAIVAKMMAKEPGRRFQQPKEVALALKPFFKSGNVAFPGSKPELTQEGPLEARPRTTGAVPVPIQPAPGMASAPKSAVKEPPQTARPELVWGSLIDLRDTNPVRDAVPAVAQAKWKRPWTFWLAIAAASMFGVAALGVVVYLSTNKGRIKIEVNDEDVVVKIDDRETYSVEGLGERIMVRVGSMVTMSFTFSWTAPPSAAPPGPP